MPTAVVALAFTSLVISLVSSWECFVDRSVVTFYLVDANKGPRNFRFVVKDWLLTLLGRIFWEEDFNPSSGVVITLSAEVR